MAIPCPFKPSVWRAKIEIEPRKASAVKLAQRVWFQVSPSRVKASEDGAHTMANKMCLSLVKRLSLPASQQVSRSRETSLIEDNSQEKGC